jgi:hypothetical protein
LQAAYVERDAVTNKSIYSVLALTRGVPLGLILALLNSRLMSWYFLTMSQVGQRDDFPKIVLKELRSLPCRRHLPLAGIVPRQQLSWPRPV